LAGGPTKYYGFPAQTFFLGGASPRCPSYHSLGLHPPTPYTLSPLLKGGERWGEGGSYTHVPCPFGAPLVTLYQIFSEGFLNGKRNIEAAASPQGWPPPQHGAAARRRRAAAP